MLSPQTMDARRARARYGEGATSRHTSAILSPTSVLEPAVAAPARLSGPPILDLDDENDLAPPTDAPGAALPRIGPTPCSRLELLANYV